jgi:hypothetical protein
MGNPISGAVQFQAESRRVSGRSRGSSDAAKPESSFPNPSAIDNWKTENSSDHRPLSKDNE